MTEPTVTQAEKFFDDLISHIQQDAIHAAARRAVMRDMTGGFYDEHLIRETIRFSSTYFAHYREAGMLEGARIMREAAELVCDDVVSPFDHHTHTGEDCAFYDATDACQAAIHALDLEAVLKKAHDAT